MKLKLINIQINSNETIVVENVEKIDVKNLKEEMIGFDFVIKKNIPEKIKIEIEFFNSLYHIPFYVFNEKNHKIEVDKKKEEVKLYSEIVDELFDFKYLIKSNVYNILDVITKELDDDFEFTKIKSIKIIPIEIQNTPKLIDSIEIDSIETKHDDNISFKKIFQFDFKYIFDEIRLLVLKYLIEEPIKNKKQIESLLISARDERKFVNNWKLFIEKVVKNLHHELNIYNSFRDYYINVINFIRKKYLNDKTKSTISFKRAIIKKVIIKSDNYNYIAKEDITRSLGIKKNQLLDKSKPKIEEKNEKDLKSSYDELNLMERNIEEVEDTFAKKFIGWQNEIKSLLSEQFMMTYTTRKNILINPLSSIIIVNIIDIENFKESINSLLNSKLDYYVELVIFSNIIDERVYSILQDKISYEEKIIGAKIIYRFNRKNTNYHMIQQLLICSNFCETNSKYIHILRDYSIVPLNWINRTLKYMEQNSKCDWLQYKKSNLINQNTGVISVYQMIDTFNMLKKSQAIHVCLQRTILENINFMNTYIKNIFYLKDLRNYLLEKRDIKINFIEKNSKNSLEKLEI